VITIDGPAGSGKDDPRAESCNDTRSPTGRHRLFYRGVMVAAARAGLAPDDRDALIECARRTEVVIDTDPAHDDADSAACVDGIEGGAALRDPPMHRCWRR